ncbi:hypothetical protein FF38_00346 [Lucilia cuprina]|uniref:Uncharacterized protein n=1 Tax=Lucilia cuprina TaxID=7375 RepID=A0A0L0CB13_LUCCU|nr:hypothetical protein FF38_00346 [Lucilia cuprina]
MLSSFVLVVKKLKPDWLEPVVRLLSLVPLSLSPSPTMPPLRNKVGAKIRQPTKLMMSRLIVKRFAVVRRPGVTQKAAKAKKFIINDSKSTAKIKKSIAIIKHNTCVILNNFCKSI